MRSLPRLARSYLFAPGDNEKLLGKVFTAGADAVVLDLEDAVAPARKAVARALVAATLAGLPAEGARENEPLIYVRCNALTTEDWQADLAVAAHPLVRGVRLAKAETLAQLQTVDEALRALEEQRGLPAWQLRLVPTIESARGLLNAVEMARHPRVETFCFGAADFVKDIQAELDEAETATLYARSQLVAVARAAELLPPIASVYTKLHDAAGLRASTLAQRRLGFFGRSCIHPAQLAVVHEVFTPSAAELQAARALVEAATQAAAHGAGVTTLADGQFVDAPLVERARAILSLAEVFVEASPPDAV